MPGSRSRNTLAFLGHIFLLGICVGLEAGAALYDDWKLMIGAALVGAATMASLWFFFGERGP